MKTAPPSLIALDPDDYHAVHVGHLVDGRQAFVTTPFVPELGDEKGREFIAAYLFDSQGALVEARVDDLGTRPSVDEAEARQTLARRLAELGPLRPSRIHMRPFAVERFGVTFGLVARPSDEGGDWWVEVLPGNYMAFHEPWESGEYDT